MSQFPKHEVLIVDDDSAVRNTLSMVLTSAGYSVSTAEHGFDALLQLRLNTPKVIISDLNMPQMSGFELLSVVRRRFPQIMVIAASGAYESRDSLPGGVLADGFYPKGRSDPARLLTMVAELARTSVVRAIAHQSESAPVWIPRNGKDVNGNPYVVLTCTECLRSFPLSLEKEDIQDVQETICLFCTNLVRYIIDFSLAVASPRKNAGSAAMLREENAEAKARTAGE